MTSSIFKHLVIIGEKFLIKKYTLINLNAENFFFNREQVGIKIAIISLEVYIHYYYILIITKKKTVFYLFITYINVVLLSALSNLVFIN